MTTVEVDAGELVIRVRGLHRILAFKSELRVPLAHVEGVYRADEELRERKGWHAPGTSVPGFWAGTFYSDAGRVFWDVAGGDKAIAIALRADRFAKLVIDVEDPDGAIALIRGALGAAAH